MGNDALSMYTAMQLLRDLDDECSGILAMVANDINDGQTPVWDVIDIYKDEGDYENCVLARDENPLTAVMMAARNMKGN